MAEILFDISLRSKIEAGEYKVVVRYDNRTFNARIICWDFNSTDLLVCVNYGDKEDVLEYDWNGKHVGKSIRRPDLLIVTPESEPEFTEFEKRLWKIMKSEGSPIGPLEKFTDDDKRVFHAYSGQLLALSRKELYPEVDLEKEIEKYCRIYYNCNYPDQIQSGRCSPVMPHIVETARYFYELGVAARREESVCVAESPSKTFPRVNEFDCGGSYRH